MIRIRGVSAHDHFTGAILQEAPFGIWVHWDGRKSIPCYKGQAHCHGCDTEMPSRWKGFLELWEGGNTKPYFVELTPLAAKEFAERLGKEPMRGLRVSVQRERRHIRAPLVVTILDRHFGQLPKWHDPYETLQVIWGLKK